MMQWYMTEYAADCTIVPRRDRQSKDHIGRFGGWIHARDQRHARRLAEKRRLGERVVGRAGRTQPYDYPSDVVRKSRRLPSKKIEAIHAVCFLCFVAVRSGVVHVVDVLGDQGLLHDTIHLMEFGRTTNPLIVDPKKLIAKIREIERATPGFRAP